MVLCVNQEPSKDLCYSSLIVDEQNRSARASTIPLGPRFKQIPQNGNIATVVPEAQDEEVRKTLPKRYQLDTSTRTVFSDGWYDKGHPIHDYVADPKNTLSSLKAEGHVSLDQVDTKDTRIRKLTPQYDKRLGPGAYHPDPLGEKMTGTLTIKPGEVHHVISYARDPTRQSAAFKSPERHHTVRDLAEEQARSPVVDRPVMPDYASWTARGCYTPKGDRKIEADRWGESVREMRPAAKDRPQAVYVPVVKNDGRPATSQSYAAEPHSPAYKAAFHSGRPRLAALPGGNKADTRLSAASYEALSTTDTNIGPGSYNPEQPRFKSPNASYQHTEPYFSLASGTPTSFLSLTGSAPTSPAAAAAAAYMSLPTSPLRNGGSSRPGTSASMMMYQSGPLPHRPGTAAAGGLSGVFHAHPREHVSHNFNAPMSAPSSPVASPSAVAAEQAALIRQMTARAGHATPSAYTGRAPTTEETAEALLRAMTMSHGGGGGGDSMATAAAASMTGRMSSAGMSMTGRRSSVGGGSTPSSPHPVVSPASSSAASMMLRARHAQFGKLMFSTRHTSHKALIRSRLAVVQDVKRERATQRALSSSHQGGRYDW